MSMLEQWLAQAAAFTRKHVADHASLWRWATVETVDPVTIRYDGTSTVGIIPPTVLATPVSVGDRVRTITVRGQTVAIPVAPFDTDWIFLTLSPGWTGLPAQPPAMRQVGSQVFASGHVTYTGGDIPSSYTEVFKVPVAIDMPSIPASALRLMGMGAGGMPIGWDIQTGTRSARVIKNGNLGADSAWASLDHIRWRTD